MKIKKVDVGLFFVALYILGFAIFVYCRFGLWEERGFPTAQVLPAIPLAIFTWMVAALGEREIYFSLFAFLACVTFGTTAYTAMFIFGTLP